MSRRFPSGCLLTLTTPHCCLDTVLIQLHVISNFCLARLAMHRINRTNDFLYGDVAMLSDLADCGLMRSQRSAASSCWHSYIIVFRSEIPLGCLLPVISPHCRLDTVLIPLHAISGSRLLRGHLAALSDFIDFGWM